MTEQQAQYQTEAQVPAKREPVNIKLTDHGLLPGNYQELLQFAALIKHSGLTPKGFNSVEQVALGILYNMEHGRPIITGLQDLAVINGKVGTYGAARIALVYPFMEEGYPIEEEVGEPFTDGWTFLYKVKRKNRKEAVGRFTWAEAKMAGFDKAHPDSPWKRFPRRMMQWKARNWVIDDQFADILKGMRATEELADAIDLEQMPGGAYGVKQEKVVNLQERISSHAQQVRVQGQEEAKPTLEVKDEDLCPETECPDREECMKQEVGPEATCSKEEPDFTCPHCGFKAVSEKGLKRHITISHGKNGKEEPLENVDPATGEVTEEPQAVEAEAPAEDPAPAMDPEEKVDPAPHQEATAQAEAEPEDDIERFWKEVTRALQIEPSPANMNEKTLRLFLQEQAKAKGYKTIEDLIHAVMTFDRFGAMWTGYASWVKFNADKLK